MAEWLRRLTRNQIPSGSVGSNPTGRGSHFPEFFFSYCDFHRGRLFCSSFYDYRMWKFLMMCSQVWMCNDGFK